MAGTGRHEFSDKLWSSETLVAGMRHVSGQPFSTLVKEEEDEALVLEYQVALDQNCFSFCCLRGLSFTRRISTIRVTNAQSP